MSYRLTDFAEIAGVEVLRDGVFERTGRLSTPLDGLCVPLRSTAYLDDVNKNPQIAAVVTTKEVADGLDLRFAVAICEQPDAAHSLIHAELAREQDNALRRRPTRIDSSAIIDSAASIAEYGVTIAPRCRIGPNVSIAPGTTVREGCVVHPGAVLGVAAFNTTIMHGRRTIIPQVGGVHIEQNVEILSNCTVARALYGGATTLGEETVIDNLVYIAHDVQIDRRVQICALVNILGRAVVGEDAYIGPSAVIKNGIRVGDCARVSIGSVVTQDVPDGATVSGNFAIPHERFIQHVRSIR